LHIALLAEANTEDRNYVETVDSPVKSKEFKLRSVQNKEQSNADTGGVDKDKAYNNENIGKRCNKMCDVMETFLSKCAIATNPTSPPVTPQYPRTPPTCYKCGVICRVNVWLKGTRRTQQELLQILNGQRSSVTGGEDLDISLPVRQKCPEGNLIFSSLYNIFTKDYTMLIHIKF